jgi:hypothetical protein
MNEQPDAEPKQDGIRNHGKGIRWYRAADRSA